MNPRLLLLAVAVGSLGILAGPVPAQESGYTLSRIVLWGEKGEPPPRFERDSRTGDFSLLFPPPAPETGWEPVEARRLVMRGPSFLPAEPVRILRPRDPDPDWASTASEASFDLNRDGIAEIVRARTVMTPDERDPSGVHQRVLVEVLEGERVLFGDLLEGPGGQAVRARSIATADVTRDGYPDMMVRLESEGRGGIAFYSQASLRCAEAATRVIEGFSTTAFRSDRYGVFDLRRIPRDFFSRLPGGARADNPRCASGRPPAEGDGHARCRFAFNIPYLGWIRAFRIDFIPDREIVSFELLFPTGAASLETREALEFLTPVLGANYRTEERKEGDALRRLWVWRGEKSTARLSALEKAGKSRATSLRLERN